jgi:hypothetical protein
MAEKTYRVFECCPDGSLHDTGKTIKRIPLKISETHRRDDFIKDVFLLYGFTEYNTYYYVNTDGSNINITYNYGGNMGTLNTWVLKPETEEKEDGDDK